MIGIALGFPSGRFHATPWGRHVNEGVPEWPPSPWRLLRSFVATWKRKLEDRIPLSVAHEVLASLLEPPVFVLPPVGTGHARHYMPWFKKGPEDRTLVFDAFVALPREAEILALWPDATIAESERNQLELILAHINFFGRAESWCSTRLLTDVEASTATARANCVPTNGACDLKEQELVRVLCADGRMALANDAFEKAVSRRVKGKLSEARERTAPNYDPDWHLCAETAWLHKERWSDPPGSRWVQYARPRDCFKTEPVRRQSQRLRSRPQVARFALDSSVLPLVTDTLRVAEAARRALMSIFGRAHRGPDGTKGVSRIFSGKDDGGQPLHGHRHAFFLPTNEDNDERLDHVTVVAEDGFDAGEIDALDALRRLRTRDRDDSTCPLRVLWLGWGSLADYQVGPLRSSQVWVSATPFVAPRYPKARGTKRDAPEIVRSMPKFLEAVLREELARLIARDSRLSGISLDHVRIETLVDEQGVFRIPRSKDDRHGLRPIQFARYRQKHGDDGGRRPAGAFRITFPEKVAGPICLGHSSHFGLGLFVPEDG